MFQGLHQGSPFYVLSKADPKIDIGEVVSVSNPVPQYPTSFNPSSYAPTNVVDIVVKIGDEQVNFNKLRADLSIADTNNGMVVVSDSREAIISEIEAFEKSNQKNLDKVPYWEHVREECPNMIALLSPQSRREAEQAAEIEGIKNQLSGMGERFDKLENLLTKALKAGSSKTEQS